MLLFSNDTYTQPYHEPNMYLFSHIAMKRGSGECYTLLQIYKSLVVVNTCDVKYPQRKKRKEVKFCRHPGFSMRLSVMLLISSKILISHLNLFTHLCGSPPFGNLTTYHKSILLNKKKRNAIATLNV